MIVTEPSLSETLKPGLILCNVPMKDKTGVLRRLAEAVCAVIPGLDSKDLLIAIAQREKMGPMPLGKGIAFCHSRTDKVPELTIAMAICPEGVGEFTPPDEYPVRIVLLFLIPKQHSDLYLRTMSVLFRQLSRPEVMEKTLSASDPGDVVAALSGDAQGFDLETVSDYFASAQSGEPATEVLARTPPAILAEFIEDLAPDARARFLSKLEPSKAADVVERMHLIPAAAAVRRMLPEGVAKIISRIGVGHAADILQQLKAEEQSGILKYLGIRGGKEVEAVLKYPASTAGGVMTPEALSLPETGTVAEALKAIAAFPDRRQTDLYVVAPAGHLMGKCVVQELLAASPDAKLSEVMQRGVETIQPDQDHEEIRRRASRHNLASIPVVGPHGTLLGVVTADDILDVIEREATEEIYRVVGAAEIVDPLHTPIASRIRMRMPWLLLTLGGELFIALVIAKIFAPTLEKAVVLAAFIPAIMATGGNVGLQSTTMVIRSLGMGTLKPKHTRRLIIGEVKLGIVTGLGCGVIAAMVAYLINWNYHEVLKVSLSVFLAMMSATLATSVMGTLEPLVLHRLKFDPATACGPFVTMFNDVFGSIVYLLIAMMMNFSTP